MSTVMPPYSEIGGCQDSPAALQQAQAPNWLGLLFPQGSHRPMAEACLLGALASPIAQVSEESLLDAPSKHRKPRCLFLSLPISAKVLLYLPWGQYDQDTNLSLGTSRQPSVAPHAQTLDVAIAS